MAEEHALRSDGDSSLELGDMWRRGCTKSPVWSGDGYGKRVTGPIELERACPNPSISNFVAV